MIYKDSAYMLDNPYLPDKTAYINIPFSSCSVFKTKSNSEIRFENYFSNPQNGLYQWKGSLDSEHEINMIYV